MTRAGQKEFFVSAVRQTGDFLPPFQGLEIL